MLDIHVHGGGYGTNFRIIVRNKDSSVRIEYTADRFAKLIQSHPSFNNANAIRLFCCDGDGGGQEIAKLLNKPVITSTDKIGVNGAGRMSMEFGTMVLYTPE